MSESGTFTIYTDGAARGNPGPAAFAYVLRPEGGADIEAKGLLGNTTNNIAEYEALVRALEHAGRLGARRVQVFSDSELLVRQMRGEYQVKNEGLRPLYEEAVALRRRFDGVTFQHVPRAQNSRADRLCNEALDGNRPAPTKKKARPKAAARPAAQEAVREEAIECLRAVAGAWARGNANDPRPEDVWEQLWSILEEAGALRTARAKSENV
jgi:ribonuclease HI